MRMMKIVRRGRVRAVDMVGNDRAGEAADFGRRRVEVAGRSGVCLVVRTGGSVVWGGWQGWPALSVNADDVRASPCSVGSLVKLVAFLSSLHWPSEIHDLHFCGISYIELSHPVREVSWERLIPEKSVLMFRRPGRPILWALALIFLGVLAPITVGSDISAGRNVGMGLLAGHVRRLVRVF